MREQLKIIKDELGEGDSESEVEEFLRKTEELDADDEIKQKLKKEITRYKTTSSGSAEASVSRGYIETLLEMPWNKMSEDNLDIAMRENAVIKLESDYQSSYEGFDPNSIDSYIMFDLMQSDYMNQSLQFATLVQKQFVDSLKRGDRGVRQAAFLVLLRTTCPSVLIEMGFISNLDEERFLASEEGKIGITRSIFRAFSQFYKPGKAVPPLLSDTVVVPTTEQQKVEAREQAKASITYKVQIFSTRKKLPKNDPAFKGLKNCTSIKDGVWLKYMYGSCKTYNEAKQLQAQVKKKFADCIVVAFKDDEQIPVKQAIELQK